jgi:hypothetical protein
MIHILHEGRALCGKAGPPGMWGKAHKWVRVAHRAEATCEKCCAAAAGEEKPTYENQDARTGEALEKIKAILCEYDLWAAFTVVSTERAHWLYHFEPSWSCLHFNPATGEARIRAKVADFATPEQQQHVVELTTGAIASTRDYAAKQFRDAEALYAILAKQFEITHEYSDPQFAKGKPDG